MLYTCSKVVFMFIVFKMQCIMFLTQPVRNCKVAFANICRIDSFQILCKMIAKLLWHTSTQYHFKFQMHFLVNCQLITNTCHWYKLSSNPTPFYGTVVAVKLPMQSEPTTISCEFKFRSCRGLINTTLCDKFVSNLQQVSGFLQVLQFPPPIKLTAKI